MNDSSEVEKNEVKKSSSLLYKFLSVFASIIKALGKTAWSFISTILKFFLKLRLQDKVIFIVILFVFVLATFLFGKGIGYNDGFMQAEKRVQELTSYKIEDLGRLVNEIERLRSTLNEIGD